jgi:hypothetical protein
MEDAIANGVRDGGVGEEVMPPVVFELTRHDRRAEAVAVFEDLEKIATRILGERSDSEIIKHEDVHLCDAREQARMAPVGTRQTELVKETRDASVEYTESFSARMVGERAGEVALTRSRCPGDDHRLMLAHPAAGRELSNDGLVELSLAWEVDPLDARLRDPELRVAKVPREASVLAREHLGVDEQRETLIEREREGVGRLVLLEPRARQDAQT